MSDDRESLGKRIRRLRDRENLTQAELAYAAGVSASQVSRWENGRETPDQTSKASLAAVFDIDVRSLAIDQDLTHHAEKGPLSKDEVAFVRRVYELVREHIERRNPVKPNENYLHSFQS